MPVEFMVREGEAVMRKGRQGADPVDAVYGKIKLPRPVDAVIEEMRGPGSDASSPCEARPPMITAVDTSVLLGVLAADATHGERSREALRDAFASGALSTCEVVWAEVARISTTTRIVPRSSPAWAFGSIRCRRPPRFSPVGCGGSITSAAGRQRMRVVADFLIGAHASVEADALLTRDRGFYRDYFRGLRVIDPSRRR